MSTSGKFRFQTIALTIGVVGALAWRALHHPNSNPVPHRVFSKPVHVAVREINPAAAVPDWPFPNPGAATTDEELLALARQAVVHSPQRAIQWARSQSNATLRRRLLSAVIRAWGERDADAAVDWVLMQNGDELRVDMEAALAGAVTQPQLAVAIVRQLLINDPTDPDACAPALVVALNDAGQFQTTLQFLDSVAAESRTNWTTATFRRWGQSQPEDALQALDSISGEDLRDAAFRALADGWSQNNPSNLAVYANSMTTGENRDYALKQAFDNWSLQDPETMAAWLNQQPPGPEFDQVVALMLSKIDSANSTPEIAMSWVEGIGDPTLKLDSFARVLGEWNQTDPAAAQQYVAGAGWLDQQQRQEILKLLQNPPAPVANNGN